MHAGNGKPRGKPSAALPVEFERIAEELSPVPRRIFELLADGEMHLRQEIHALLWDTESPLTNIQQHISNIRKVVGPRGLVIVAETAFQFKRGYRMARHVGKSE